MDLHSRPLDERIRWLLGLAEAHARTWGPKAAREHPAPRVVALQCMDGRVHLPHATGAPPGRIRSFHNLGGCFHPGWPLFGERLVRTLHQAAGTGRPVPLLITYHFSRGDRGRGCAGFDCDTDAARAYAFRIRTQVLRLFAQHKGCVYPLVCGYETDLEALILHGAGGQTLDLADLSPEARQELAQRVRGLFPDMPSPVCQELLPLLEGNLRHIDDLRHAPTRGLYLGHREWALCVGEGFDFLHRPNSALIIGPYAPDLSGPIRSAAAILRSNVEAGRIPDDGCLLLALSPSQEGVERQRAECEARFLAEYTAGVVADADPDLARRMVRHTAVLDRHEGEWIRLDP